MMMLPLLFTSCEECDCEVNGVNVIDYSPLEEKAQIMKTAFENKDTDTMLELLQMTWNGFFQMAKNLKERKKLDKASIMFSVYGTK